MKRFRDSSKVSIINIIRSYRAKYASLSCALIRYFPVIFFVVCVSGCTAGGYKLLKDIPEAQTSVYRGHFDHLVLVKGMAMGTGQAEILPENPAPLIVFIDGDGRPWDTRYRISHDPTPDHPLLLQWFIDANHEAIYLGRPCYFDLDDDACDAYWYTHGRYSSKVIESMSMVLQNVAASRSLILIGHSGGGTLAVLMAEALENVQGVVTIAANLAVEQWANYHQYSPLVGSLDPYRLVTETTKNSAAREMHFYSLHDTNVLADWIREYSKHRENAVAIELASPDHNTGWHAYKAVIMEKASALITIE